MTQTQALRAYRLYVQFKTTSQGYKDLAAQAGMTVLDLNQRVHALYVQRKFGESK